MMPKVDPGSTHEVVKSSPYKVVFYFSAALYLLKQISGSDKDLAKACIGTYKS